MSSATAIGITVPMYTPFEMCASEDQGESVGLRAPFDSGTFDGAADWSAVGG